MERGKAADFTEDDQGMIWFKNRICVPDVGDLQMTIMREVMIQLIPFTQVVLKVPGSRAKLLVVWDEERCGRSCRTM
jgi:hypothetical protein